MSIVRLVDVSRSYGARHLFGPVTVSIEAGDRIGLIGPNGSGKTSLLRLIAGGDRPNEGTVFSAQRLRFGYYEQEPDIPASATPYSLVMESLQHLTSLAQTMRELEQAMSQEASQDALADLMDRYARVSETFERDGGYEADATVRATLFGLGLPAECLERPAGTLSGGERSRVGLARLLVARPDLLILDEPTNHLDIAATQWLEEAFRSHQGALIVVSHDRYFLDAVANRIWEIDETGHFAAYRGNYSAAMSQREAGRERRLEAYAQQQEEIERLEAYVRKYKAGNRATMAKSRERRLERMERIEQPKGEAASLSLNLDTGSRGSRAVARLEAVGHSYGDNRVLKGVSTTIERGDRVGIMGPNGSGKSTLLSIVCGLLNPSEGAAYLGRDIDVAYYSQETEEFGPGNAVIDELLAAQHMTTPEARSYLARFLFRGDDVFKSVEALSGGEKRRLMLAKLLLSSFNLLCLDEPTNHLDIPAREVLEEALASYTGTLVFVSHDRYFLSHLATRLIIVHDGAHIELFDGGYEAYVERQKVAQNSSVKPTTPRRPVEPRQERQVKSEKALQREIAAVEAHIEQLEQQRVELERQLADPTLYGDAEQAKAVTSRYRTLEDEISAAYATWDAMVSSASSGQ